MKHILLSVIFAFISGTLVSQSPIAVTILSSEPGSGITQIEYQLPSTCSSYDISAEVSFDNGSNYTAIPEIHLVGALTGLSPGTHTLIWDGAAGFPDSYQEQTRIKIIATPVDFCCGVSQLTDVDGNAYNTVLIGTQCWMKENLKVGKDPDGNPITRYCYENNASNCTTYGGLYDWATMMDGASSSNSVPSGVQGICPDGWHVPGDEEWTALTGYVSSQPGYLCDATVSYIGKALASAALWNNSTTTCAVGNTPGINNATGFSGLPGGYRDSSGDFHNVDLNGYWWSSTEFNDILAWNRYLYYGTPGVGRYNDGKVNGYSVRCLRD